MLGDVLQLLGRLFEIVQLFLRKAERGDEVFVVGASQIAQEVLGFGDHAAQFLPALLRCVAEELHEECGSLLQTFDLLVVHGLNVLLLLLLRFGEGAVFRVADLFEFGEGFLFALFGRGVGFSVELIEGGLLFGLRLRHLFV